MNWKRSFRESYCAKFACAPDKYESAVLRAGLHRRSLAVTWIVRLVKPGFFEPELRTIRYLGNATSSEEFRGELDSYRSEYRRHGGFVRKLLAVRLSGSRLMRLQMQVMDERAPAPMREHVTPPSAS